VREPAGDSGQWSSGVVDAVVAGVVKVVVVVSGTCWLPPRPGQPFNREREEVINQERCW
jgi:hypothetical protein